MSAEAEDSSVRLEMLRGSVSLIYSRAPVPIDGPVTAYIAARLALAAPGAVSFDDLSAALGYGPKTAKNNLQQRIRDLKNIGLPVKRLGDAYQLELDPAAIDAFRFVKAASLPKGRLSSEEALGFLKMWNGGPPAFEERKGHALVPFGLLHEAYEKLHNIAHTRRAKRVLIVEDKIGPRLQELLSVESELARDPAEFNAIADLGAFDLILLDLNLTSGYDQSGATLAKRMLKNGVTVPVLAMTAGRPTNSKDVTTFLAEHGLVGLVFKNGDDGEAKLDNIVEVVDELLEQDPDQFATTKMEQSIPPLRQKALSINRARGGHDAGKINQEADALHQMRDGSAATMRAAIAAFVRDRLL